jgi:hypothetical protein
MGQDIETEGSYSKSEIRFQNAELKPWTLRFLLLHSDFGNRGEGGGLRAFPPKLVRST